MPKFQKTPYPLVIKYIHTGTCVVHLNLRVLLRAEHRLAIRRPANLRIELDPSILDILPAAAAGESVLARVGRQLAAAAEGAAPRPGGEGAGEEGVAQAAEGVGEEDVGDG